MPLSVDLPVPILAEIHMLSSFKGKQAHLHSHPHEAHFCAFWAKNTYWPKEAVVIELQ